MTPVGVGRYSAKARTQVRSASFVFRVLVAAVLIGAAAAAAPQGQAKSAEKGAADSWSHLVVSVDNVIELTTSDQPGWRNNGTGFNARAAIGIVMIKIDVSAKGGVSYFDYTFSVTVQASGAAPLLSEKGAISKDGGEQSFFAIWDPALSPGAVHVRVQITGGNPEFFTYFVDGIVQAAAPAAAAPPATTPKSPPTAKLVLRGTVPPSVSASSPQTGTEVPITYRLRLTNEGDAPATDVALRWVVDLRPAFGLTPRIVTSADSWPCQMRSDQTRYMVECGPGTLAPNASVSVNVDVTAPYEPDTLTADAIASGTCPSQPCSASWHAVTTVGDGARLRVNISANPQEVRQGERATYAVTVKNTGATAIAPVRFLWEAMNEPVAGGVTGPAGWNCRVDGHRVVCGDHALGAGETVTLNVTAEVGGHTLVGGYVPDKDYYEEVRARVEGTCEPQNCEDMASVQVLVHVAVPLRVRVTAPEVVGNGDQVIWTVNITNSGAGDARVSQINLSSNIDWSARDRNDRLTVLLAPDGVSRSFACVRPGPSDYQCGPMDLLLPKGRMVRVMFAFYGHPGTPSTAEVEVLARCLPANTTCDATARLAKPTAVRRFQ